MMTKPGARTRKKLSWSIILHIERRLVPIPPVLQLAVMAPAAWKGSDLHYQTNAQARNPCRDMEAL